MISTRQQTGPPLLWSSLSWLDKLGRDTRKCMLHSIKVEYRAYFISFLFFLQQLRTLNNLNLTDENEYLHPTDFSEVFSPPARSHMRTSVILWESVTQCLVLCNGPLVSLGWAQRPLTSCPVSAVSCSSCPALLIAASSWAMVHTLMWTNEVNVACDSIKSSATDRYKSNQVRKNITRRFKPWISGHISKSFTIKGKPQMTGQREQETKDTGQHAAAT